MNPQEVLKLAKQVYGYELWTDSSGTAGRLGRFAELVEAAERERCIDILERLHERSGDSHNYYLHAVRVIKGDI